MTSIKKKWNVPTPLLSPSLHRYRRIAEATDPTVLCFSGWTMIRLVFPSLSIYRSSASINYPRLTGERERQTALITTPINASIIYAGRQSRIKRHATRRISLPFRFGLTPPPPPPPPLLRNGLPTFLYLNATRSSREFFTFFQPPMIDRGIRPARSKSGYRQSSRRTTAHVELRRATITSQYFLLAAPCPRFAMLFRGYSCVLLLLLLYAKFLDDEIEMDFFLLYIDFLDTFTIRFE